MDPIDAVSSLQSARIMAREWGEGIDERRRQQAAWAFIKTAIDEYARELSRLSDVAINISDPLIAITYRLEASASELARTVGREAASLGIEQACYQISSTYTVLVPSGVRSDLGMYYTPPALTDRLLAMAADAGVDWRKARVLDPACGGGAFLLPVAVRMREALSGLKPSEQFDSITTRLRGFEIDPFAAWLTQTWLEIALADLRVATGKALPKIVQVCDTLEQEPDGELFDLVVGNPPYGRVSLTPEQRSRFARSLFGHANLYGVFTDAALRWTKPKGVIAYVTPTSFLAGEYFKALRSLIADTAPPVSVDFVEARRGVFEDVLQETLLATYRRNGKAGKTSVHYLSVPSDTAAEVTQAGRFSVPPIPSAPWIVPRLPSHQKLVDRLSSMHHRLSDWGYQVSTGPLVWNRYKTQLRSRPGQDTFPLIWAEAVTPGSFAHRADKRNHEPYFKVEGPEDDWLKVSIPCVLVQRTTAKEQSRRLIAAELPASFIRKHRAVVVENHLNMVRPINGKTSVTPAALSAILNSAVVDEAFRCISGSVAVSAFELEALPLPAPSAMRRVEKLIADGASQKDVEAKISSLYFGDCKP
jgi:adenine-specific DNA-methyltransferase